MAALASFEPATDDAQHAPTSRRLPAVARISTLDGRTVCERCDVADRLLPRMRGLLGRTGLEAGTGLLIDASPSVHMFFMRFAIDVVFLDIKRRIVGTAHTLRRWRVAGARRAVAALELPAGTAARHDLAVGDLLTIEAA